MTRTLVTLIASTLLVVINLGCSVTDRSIIEKADNTHKALEPAIIRDPTLAQYLQSVGERIIASAREADEKKIGPGRHFDKSQDDAWMYSKGMQFHLVNSKTLNAFTTGGEHMYIYTELFNQCKTEDELAAVMAHEYAHVYCRHVAEGTKNQMTTLVAGALLGAGAGYALGGKDDKLAAAGAGAGVGAAGGQFLNMGFTRKDEDEADKYGFYFYTHAGWAPDHFADFFQHMIDAGYDKTPEMMSDHPTLKSRVDNTKRRVSELPPEAREWDKKPIADASRFKDLQHRAQQLGKKLPDDKSLSTSQELLQALPRSCVAPVDPKDAQEARERLAKRAQNADVGTETKKKKK